MSKTNKISDKELQEKANSYFDNPNYKDKDSCLVTGDGQVFHGDEEGRINADAYAHGRGISVIRFERNGISQEEELRPTVSRDKLVKEFEKLNKTSHDPFNVDSLDSFNDEEISNMVMGLKSTQPLKKDKEVKKSNPVDISKMKEDELIDFAINKAGSKLTKSRLKKMNMKDIRSHVDSLLKD
jgi:hypothetical protein